MVLLEPEVPLRGVRTALWAWQDRHYHLRRHGGLMGRRPLEAWREGTRGAGVPLTAGQLARALEVSVSRRVAKDHTFQLHGRTYEVAPPETSASASG